VFVKGGECQLEDETRFDRKNLKYDALIFQYNL